MSAIRLLLVCVLVFSAAVARADSAAFTFSGGTVNSGQFYTYGFNFVPIVNINVTSLGFLDQDANGLASSHPVSIWSPSGQLLTSASVTTANSTLSGPVVNGAQFRYTTITPIELFAGTIYTLGAFENQSTDVWYATGANLSASPALLSVLSTGVYTYGDADPVQSIGNTYAIGNFTATAASTAVTPEPSSLALLGTGLLSAIGIARRLLKENSAAK